MARKKKDEMGETAETAIATTPDGAGAEMAPYAAPEAALARAAREKLVPVHGSAGMQAHDVVGMETIEHRRDLEVALAAAEERVAARIQVALHETRRAAMEVATASSNKDRAATALLANAPAPLHGSALANKDVVMGWLANYAEWFSKVQRWRDHGDYDGGGW